MPVINRISDYFDEMQGWRHQIHSNPELGFECFETAKFVKSKLKEFGVDEIHSGIAKTGIVAIINGKSNGSKATMSAGGQTPVSGYKLESKKAQKKATKNITSEQIKNIIPYLIPICTIGV